MSQAEFENTQVFQETIRQLGERYSLKRATRELGRTNFAVFLGKEKKSGSWAILKLGPEDGIQRELSGYRQLKPYLPLPQVTEFSSNYIAFEYLGGKTLYDVLKEKKTDPDALYRFHRALSQRMVRLWSATSKPYNPKETIYDHSKETHQVFLSMRDFLESELKFPTEKRLIVNGETYPSLESTVQQAISQLHDAPYSVLDPGDVNTQNIIVTPDLTRWWVIDPEKTGRYDPAYSLARHLCQWELHVTSAAKSIPKVKKGAETLKIFYAKDLLPGVPGLAESTYLLGKEFASHAKDATFFQRVSYYSLLFYLRFAAVPTSWLFRFVKPKLIPSFVAEGIKSFYRYQK